MIIGLTGGVATGKTLVAEEFRRLGAVVIDTDELAREVVRPGGPAYTGIVEAFGAGILQADGVEIDRKALGSLVFGDDENLKRLNSLTHPHILKIMRERVREAKAADAKAVIIVVVPLLYEVGLEGEMDAVAVVSAPEETQVKRLMARDGLSREEALRRVSAQLPIDEKKRRGDYVIENTGSMEDALREARRVYSAIAGGD
jgi:dephospho-CoA kinase